MIEQMKAELIEAADKFFIASFHVGDEMTKDFMLKMSKRMENAAKGNFDVSNTTDLPYNPEKPFVFYQQNQLV